MSFDTDMTFNEFDNELRSRYFEYASAPQCFRQVKSIYLDILMRNRRSHRSPLTLTMNSALDTSNISFRSQMLSSGLRYVFMCRNEKSLVSQMLFTFSFKLNTKLEYARTPLTE